MTHILGIDAGSSIIKATLFDLNGHEVARAGVECPAQHPHPGWAELEMEAVWQGVVESVRRLLQEGAIAATDIRAVGITGQGDGTWLVDADHRPVRPAILWSDSRTADFVRAAQTNGLSEAVFQITGTVLNTSNMAAQIRWLATHEPETLARAQYALRAKDWIFLQMTGVVSTDESDASYTFFALKERAYSHEIWDLLEVGAWRHLAPPVRPAYENRAELLPTVADQLGLRAGTPVVAGPLDAVAVAVGVGAIEIGDACTSLGTAGIHQIVLGQPDAAPANVGYTICHAPANRWLRLLPTMSCTSNLQWAVDHFFQAEVTAARDQGKSSWAALEALAAQVPVGSNGVMFHPYIDPAGERAPFVRPEVRAQFTGLTSHHSRADLLRAVYEGVLLSALDCYAHLPAQVKELKLGGGGARSNLWAQLFADALGAPVVVVEGEEFGAKGAAINAGVAIGIYASYQDAAAQTIRPARRYEPNPAQRPIYQELLHLYRATYQAMFPIWEQRAALQQRLVHGLKPVSDTKNPAEARLQCV